MNMTDPIADMITRIRNGVRARLPKIDVPASRLKSEIARILKDEGYIAGYQIVESQPHNVLKIFLKYGPDKESVITGLKRVSKPGLRKYTKAKGLPQVLNGLGIAIVSTSRGVVTDKTARSLNAGGEIICEVW